MNAIDLRVRSGFASAGVPEELVDEFLSSFAEAKRRFHRADLRPSAIEGGRFSEAVFRILQWVTAQAYTPLGKTLPSVDNMIATLQNSQGVDSVRLHIPRTLRLIYDVRNRRDIAHLADGIDPNLQDASLVIRNMEWVVAELVRLFHDVSPAEAYGVIADLVSKDVPLIQVFDGFPRVLIQLRASDHFLALLYWCGPGGATLEELRKWARPAMRGQIRRTMNGLDAKDFVHLQEGHYVLTRLGEREVEVRKLLEPQ